MKHSDRGDFPTIQIFDWDNLEARYRTNYYNGTGRANSVLQHEGIRPVIFTAPHSLNHYRNGQVKLADRWTGSMAEILATETGSGYLTACGEIAEWSSWENRTDDFKLSLDELTLTPTLVIDLHGMSDRYGVDLCIGLGPAPDETTMKFADEISRGMARYRVSINDPFSADPAYTVTNYVQRETASSALQLEIASRFRNPQTSAKLSFEFLANLAHVIGPAIDAL